MGGVRRKTLGVRRKMIGVRRKTVGVRRKMVWGTAEAERCIGCEGAKSEPVAR